MNVISHYTFKSLVDHGRTDCCPCDEDDFGDGLMDLCVNFGFHFINLLNDPLRRKVVKICF